MKNMLLVIPLLIGGCASENSSPKAILMDLIEQKNPVAIDWVNSFSGSGAKFKWHYSTDEYKSLNKLNEACNIWFESSGSLSNLIPLFLRLISCCSLMTESGKHRVGFSLYAGIPGSPLMLLFIGRLKSTILI